MKTFFKNALLCSFLCLLPDATQMQACAVDFPYERYPYQCWLFHIDLIPTKALHLLSYPHLEGNYDYKNSDPTQPFVADTLFYKQNVAEWQAAIAADPTIVAKIADKDIHEMLYNFAPARYFKQKKINGFKQNSFMRAIQSSKAAKSWLNYLDFAKICEQMMTFLEDVWDHFPVQNPKQYSLKQHIAVGDSIVRQKTTTPFVKERTAYQMIKMAHYTRDTARVLAIYKQFFENTSSKSWIVGSASYFEAVAQRDAAVQNLHLARVFDLSIDKRWLALQTFDQSEPIRKRTLALARTPKDKVRVLMMTALQSDGRVLNDLKKAYQLDPQNNLLQIAIQREINKLENWIFTNRFTKYPTSLASGAHSSKIEDNGIAQQRIDARNLHADLNYLESVIAFVKTVATEKKQVDPAYWSLAVAHLAFLKRDFAVSRQFLAAVKTQQDVSMAVQLQSQLIELLCDLYSAPHLSADDDAAVLKFDAFLQKNKAQIFDYQNFRSQIMRFLSERYKEDGQIAKSILILSKSDLIFSDINDFWAKNFYHLLLETDNAAIIDQAIDIMQRKPRIELTDFERWLASEPKSYDRNCKYCDEDESANPKSKEWSVSKLKDYQSMIYVNHDALDSAYAVLKTIPNAFWNQYPYQDFLIGNPFWFHNAVSTSVESFMEQGVVFNKTQFIKKILDLKQQLVKEPRKKEQNYYFIGMAYYNMTHRGNFWLMSEICLDSYEPNFKRNDFKDIYFNCKRAEEWFTKGAKTCQNKDYAAMCCFMLNQIKGHQDLKPAKTVLWKDFHQRFKNAAQYEENEYWCQHLDSLMLTIDPSYTIQTNYVKKEVEKVVNPVLKSELKPNVPLNPKRTYFFNLFIWAVSAICFYMLRPYLRP
jgi:hypothetical protein